MQKTEEMPGDAYRDAAKVPTTAIPLAAVNAKRLGGAFLGSILLALVVMLALQVFPPSLAREHSDVSILLTVAPIGLLLLCLIALVWSRLGMRKELRYVLKVTDTDMSLERANGEELASKLRGTLFTACVNYPAHGRGTVHARPGVRLLFDHQELLLACLTPREAWHAVPMENRIADFNLSAQDFDVLKQRLE